jgi:hypothetical protein
MAAAPAALLCRVVAELGQLRRRVKDNSDARSPQQLVNVLYALMACVSLLHERAHESLIEQLLYLPIWESPKAGPSPCSLLALLIGPRSLHAAASAAGPAALVSGGSVRRRLGAARPECSRERRDNAALHSYCPSILHWPQPGKRMSQLDAGGGRLVSRLSVCPPFWPDRRFARQRSSSSPTWWWPTARWCTSAWCSWSIC